MPQIDDLPPLREIIRRHDDTIASYDKAIALNPGHADAHHNRGVSLQAQRKFEEALAA